MSLEKKKSEQVQVPKLKSSKQRHLRRYWQLYAMMVLPIAYFIVFKYVPMFGNVLAFRRYRPGMGPYGVSWVGFKYFNQFMKDPSFWRAFRNTFTISFMNLIINFPIPIVFAILLNEVRAVRFKKVVQTVSYMPRFISTVVVFAILGELLSPSSGLLNQFLHNVFGMEPIYFMNEPQYFRWLYVLTDSWQFTGWTAIIYLAAITGISADLFEAAQIDGANRIKQIIHVTIPSILPTIMVMLILNVGRMLSLGFEKVLLMYTPSNSSLSDIIDTLVYRTGLYNQNYSYATAIGLFSGIIGVVLVSSSNTLSKKFTGDGIY
ncbi:ABC transporter permease [Lachnoclostridium phytofermentans]|uniref:Binding-protein-dependent transport systems inner membrane component n=1 Tax=Lachnoclostridium phytofermentans (strain ATCC 700394 / DSM 18823 / ISDg) TaxID=357809 RepID=A9KMQ2_LACP7|nr:ABC transporter permease subunit [Lachnoclostridium phytofermentans]ABX41497.1 binding-protein-dependent transport systems inner membrane component [Lachnoclostridium phytofermentans ISDg]